jgi:DNA gyrase/topoisomerase IV subunit A|tara:strand:+ start:2605 stop:2895 length:291 start_codon:yes stop_codon:yes gene_type:complete
MKLTRKSLKNLISETIREQNSLLLEMPEGRDEQNEGDALKKELFHMSQKAQQLHDMLADEADLEPWVQAKITKASAMVGAVFDHLMYENRPGHVQE